jgi:hypothetical protein
MSRSKIIVVCKLCGKEFYRWCGQVNAVYCSRKCSCKSKHTKEFQSYAGKLGGAVKVALRGTGKKHPYIKEYGQHQHRVVMEKILGRKLTFNDVVHHIDGDGHNNHPSNLKLMTHAEHAKEHNFGRA